MYEDHVLKHYGEPYHKGPFPYGSAYGPGMIHEGDATSTVCGDSVHIQARIEDDMIAEVWWRGEGCCFSQAAASMLVEYADRRTIEAMRRFSEDEMFNLFKAASMFSEKFP